MFLHPSLGLLTPVTLFQCLRSTDLSVLSTKESSSSRSFKSLLRRRLLKRSKKESKLVSVIHDTRSVVTQRPVAADASLNYDMTVLHDDELDDTALALHHRRSKRIPRWAQSKSNPSSSSPSSSPLLLRLETQLQLAIVNQLYYNDQHPEQIFGLVRLDSAVQMVNAIDLCHSALPENFV